MSDDTQRAERPDKRYGWFRVYSVIGKNPKIIGLKSDAQRWAYLLTLAAARDEQVRGEFISRRYLAAALGRYARHIDALIEGELLDEDGDGRVSIPQWAYWQPDPPSRAEDQKRYRDRLRMRDGHVTQRDTALHTEETEGTGVEATRLDVPDPRPGEDAARFAPDLAGASVAPLPLCDWCDQRRSVRPVRMPVGGQWLSLCPDCKPLALEGDRQTPLEEARA